MYKNTDNYNLYRSILPAFVMLLNVAQAEVYRLDCTSHNTILLLYRGKFSED